MRVTSTLFALLMVTILGSTCSRSASTGDAATDVSASKDLGTSTDVGHAPEVPAGTVLTPPAGITFPDAPPMSCGGAADCQFPASACANLGCDGGACDPQAWVVYYDDPTCVNGQCAFTKRYFQCGNSTACIGGGCRFNGTAVN
jgi:hypothetical protein